MEDEEKDDKFRNDFQGLDKRKGIDIGIKINAESRKSAVLIIIVRIGETKQKYKVWYKNKDLKEGKCKESVLT